MLKGLLYMFVGGIGVREPGWALHMRMPCSPGAEHGKQGLQEQNLQ